MKNKIFSLLLVFTLLSVSVSAYADEMIIDPVEPEAEILSDTEDNIADLSDSGEFNVSLARSHADIINNFRTSNTWKYDEHNNRVNVSGLSALTYDYGLENCAKKRAEELATSYSHTRPDGTSCFTVFDELYPGVDYGAAGENIGYNTYGYNHDDSQMMFDLFKEEDEYYSGQGHRRNMLNPDFGYIGVARVTINGNNYWVHEFSGKPFSSEDKDGTGTEMQVFTETYDGYTATITLSKSIPYVKKKKDVLSKIKYTVSIKTPQGTQSGITVKKVNATKPKKGETKITFKFKKGSKEEKKAVKMLNKKFKKIPVKVASQ